MRKVVLGIVLAMIASMFTVGSALAWDVKTYECDNPGTSGGVEVRDEAWVGDYTLFIFLDGELVATGERGQRVDLPSGSYVGKWSNDGGETFLREKEYFTIHNDCPLPAQIISVNAVCVKSDSGVRNRVRLVVNYDTYGRELILTQDISIETEKSGTKHVLTQDNVQGEGQLVTFRYVGPGTHRVTGLVTLGHKAEAYVDTTIRCAPVPIRNPKGHIIGPCGDPQAGALYDNRRSTVTVKFKLTIAGRTVNVRNVGGGKQVVVGAFYQKPGAVVRLYAHGRLIDSASFKGGSYGWKGQCKALR